MARPSGEMVSAPRGFEVMTRTPGGRPEGQFEKPVILPQQDDMDSKKHAWADARFWTDIMAEHALFFVLLMPPEVANNERKEALEFHQKFLQLHQRVANRAPPEGDLSSFTSEITRQIEPFIEYKRTQHERTMSGELRSLVWPKFFEHTQREAERFVRRLDNLADGEPTFRRDEVVPFWSMIMDEHARFVAHLLDPDEYELVEKAMRTSQIFQDLGQGRGGAARALANEPAAVVRTLTQNPDMDAAMKAAQSILDFKTEAARGIEAARIRAIIDPRLADHVRREAIKFIDELKRAER